MANESRSFGAHINAERRAFAPLNIQNKHVDPRHINKPLQVSVNSFEGQENFIIANQKNVLAHKSSQLTAGINYKDNSFQIYDDGIFSQETAQPIDDERILDDNIEAVKKELNSFLIDSLEKYDSDVSEKENKCVEDSFMAVDLKEESSLSDSVLDQSEISFTQVHSDFDLFKDYADSILPYMLEKERKYMADPFYMNNQTHINSKMRSILVDWLVDVSDEYNIKDETLFLAINYIDRFLSKYSISRQEFQLLGTSALFIATKYEEIYPPEIGEFVYITDDSFSKLQILKMEKLILEVLDFEVSSPTSNYFLEKYISDLALDKGVYCYAKYLCFLSTLECTPFLKYYPSEIALCSILIASTNLGVIEQIPDDFIHHTFDYEQSLGDKGDVAHFLNDRNTLIEELNKLQIFANDHQQQAIQRKYSSPKYYKVAKIASAESNK